MADSEVILFDLPSKGRCACWSLNPWKVRLVLNYKAIPYKTVWVEYPDIAAHHKAAGIEPNAEGMPYTIPAVKLPSGEDLQDSKVIARKLEELKPEPSLYLGSDVIDKLEGLMPKIMVAITPIVMPRIPRDVLPARSAEYFHETRSKRFGMPLDELEKSEKGGETAWANAEEPLKEVAELLKGNSTGPFFLGKEVTFADFIFVGFLQFLQCAGQDIFDRVVGTDMVFAALYGACATWLGRDDH